METHFNKNLNQPPRGCSKPSKSIYNIPYYNPSASLSNNASYRIIYLPKAGKIDVKAKEAILITSALLLLGFSLFQFYKKWVKHYRDINQGSFTSYYYKYNSGSIMDSPSLTRKDSARVNWKKVGAAISVNARIRAIRTHKQLEEARLNDPLLNDNLKLSSEGKTNASSRRKSASAAKPTKWALVRTIVQHDEEKGTNKNSHQRRRKPDGSFDDIESTGRISQNSTKDPTYTSNKSITSCRDRAMTSNIKPSMNRITLQTSRSRIKSRSLDDNTEDKHFGSYYQPNNGLYNGEIDVFTASNVINKTRTNKKRSSVTITSKSPSNHNGNITLKISSDHENDLDTILTDDRRKSETLSHNSPRTQKTEQDIPDEKCKMHYVQETLTCNSSAERACTVELMEDDSNKDVDKRRRLDAADSWIKLPSVVDASQIV